MSVRLNLDPQTALQAVESRAEHALNSAAQILLRESRSRAPVDSGKLRESARVRSGGEKKKPKSIVSFETDYAVCVHETHPSKRKFLESALGDASLRRSLLQEMQDSMRF